MGSGPGLMSGTSHGGWATNEDSEGRSASQWQSLDVTLERARRADVCWSELDLDVGLAYKRKLCAVSGQATAIFEPGQTKPHGKNPTQVISSALYCQSLFVTPVVSM
jgi:hypothetical protein